MKRFLFAAAILLAVSAIMLSGCTTCPPAGYDGPLPPGCENANTVVQPNDTNSLTQQANSSGTNEGTSSGEPNSPSPAGTGTTAPVQKPKMVSVNFVVTVPYWTQGDIYLGVEENSKFMKLQHINEVILSGKTEIAEGTKYYYSLGDSSSDEVPVERFVSEERIFDGNIFDGVIDWKNSSKRIAMKDFQKSFYINACHSCSVSITKGNYIEPMGRAMDDIKKLGANWVNFIPVWFITPDYRGNELKPIYSEDFGGMTGWVSATMKDDDLRTVISTAHSKGLKVYLCPHTAPENWGPGVKGKGDIQPTNPDKFFESYKNFINHYAKIAQETGVEMLCVGNELDTLTQPDLQTSPYFDKDKKWRDVIASARQNYKGLLTYSVSCIDEKRCGPELITFWDALDIIGWEWYTPIATGIHEPISSMKANAERIVDTRMKKLSDKFSKPIVLTELGWEAYPGSCAHTYGVGPSKGGDRIEQSSCTEAVFQAIEGKDFIKGTQVWSYTATIPGDKLSYIWTDVTGEINMSIAEKELLKWYSKIDAK